MSRAAFDALLVAARALVAARPVLAGFAPWPAAPAWADLPPVALPAGSLVGDWPAEGDGPEADLHRAIRQAAPFAAWTRTYTEAEVGARFLENYGYFELVGPTGHYRCPDLRAYVAYWGAGLDYGWHSHEAEEVYFVVSGHGLFRSEGEEDALLGRGGARIHRANQRHALGMVRGPILTLVLWRGPGLGGRAEIQGG